MFYVTGYAYELPVTVRPLVWALLLSRNRVLMGSMHGSGRTSDGAERGGVCRHDTA